MISIATEKNGSMKSRIDSIAFLDEDEKTSILKLWNELSAWAHPYGKWIKNVCPRFYSFGRNYNPVIFEKCFNFVDVILDFMLVITVDHFKLSTKKL